MYEIHDSEEHFHPEGLFDFEADLPEPLDYWMLRDFTDIVPNVGYAS